MCYWLIKCFLRCEVAVYASRGTVPQEMEIERTSRKGAFVFDIKGDKKHQFKRKVVFAK